MQRTTCIVIAAALLLSAGSLSAGTLKIDFNGQGGDNAGADWLSASGGNYYNGSGSPTDPASITMDIDGDGNDETIWVGFDSFASSFDRNRGEDGAWTFSQEFKDLLQDFAGPVGSPSTDQLIIYGLPAGTYEIKVWMRDRSFGSGTYGLAAQQDGDDVLFEVVHADFSNSDPDTASVTHQAGTIDFDPPDGFRTWNTAPSLVFVEHPTLTATPPIAGMQITFIPEVVPEPATLGLLALGGMAMAGAGAVHRRRRRN